MAELTSSTETGISFVVNFLTGQRSFGYLFELGPLTHPSAARAGDWALRKILGSAALVDDRASGGFLVIGMGSREQNISTARTCSLLGICSVRKFEFLQETAYLAAALMLCFAARWMAFRAGR